ncbi:hypothetical protein [Mycetocola zhadangensis]|uniref:Uncharacterized protein n=1 Tax=Mycetocola zhadangensis TaxID=1164595 RepID=A0A3L7IWT0_9MICO|nr:hypothetical protein [Mycetocola zhadangensis]RLQ82653.1 hypothetical protein D9V28_11905 [Mycetocola zhadangensis]GGE99389.1 hypothetical protein GCM10011313_22940 [Mycetocola zhadangensis]
MKRIHYAGTSFVTGDVIARALIGYARALSDTATSDVVEVPIIRPDGSPGRVELLMVPTGGMLFETEPTLLRELLDDALVEDLRWRAARLVASEWKVPAEGEVSLYSDVHSIA